MANSPFKTFVVFALTALVSIAIVQLFTASTFEEKELERYQEHIQENYKVFAIPLPQKLEFAGESVPLNLIDTRERLDRELLVNTYWQSQSMLLIKRAHRWLPVIEPILKAQGVPTDLKYLAVIESGLTHTVSPAGAAGYWQFMKDAGKQYGLEVNDLVDERYHIEKSTEAACKYLKDAKEKFGTWTLAAASYNMGMGGLNNQITRQKATNFYDLNLNEETSRYLFRIMAIKLILENPAGYGFNFRKEDLYPELKYDTLMVRSSINNLAQYALENGLNYKVLKIMNPWLRDNELSVGTGRSYSIQKPVEPLLTEMIYDKEQVATFTRQKSDEKEPSGDGDNGD